MLVSKLKLDAIVFNYLFFFLQIISILSSFRSIDLKLINSEEALLAVGSFQVYVTIAITSPFV